MKKLSGLTFIELIIVLAIVGILAALAAPDFGAIVRNSQLKTTYSTFAGILATARSEAGNRESAITLCVSTNGRNCTTGKWSDGYLAFIDLDGDATVDTDDEILRYEPPISGVTITATSAFTDSITVAPRGSMRSAGTFVFCTPDGEITANSLNKSLNLWATGLGRQARDRAGDRDSIVGGSEDSANPRCLFYLHGYRALNHQSVDEAPEPPLSS